MATVQERVAAAKAAGVKSWREALDNIAAHAAILGHDVAQAIQSPNVANDKDLTRMFERAKELRTAYGETLDAALAADNVW